MLDSVRARLTFWYTAILALVLITFSGISYVLLARASRAATDSSLSDVAKGFLGNHPTALRDIHYSDRAVIILAADGRIVAASQSAIGSDELNRIITLVRNGRRGFATVQGGPEGDGVRMIAMPAGNDTVIVARDLDEQADRLENAAQAVFFGIPLALMVAALGGYILARKSFAPVTHMAAKAREIGADTLTERIAVENERDELGFLAGTLNELLERLQRAFESQRGFMADASHELRTPLAIIQGEADVVLSRRDRSPDEYRESLQIIQAAVRKVTRIVESVFLLARSDAGKYPIVVSRFYLDELLAETVRAMRTVAAGRDIELSCHSPAELLIAADEALLHRMMLNLVENALKFTPSGGRVRVEAEEDEGRYIIRVIDTGSGVEEDERERIFERFYRGASTGAGLGLPIARWIAEAHGGTLTLQRSDGNGSTFVALLPITRSEAPRPVPAALPSTPDTSRSRSR